MIFFFFILSFFFTKFGTKISWGGWVALLAEGGCMHYDFSRLGCGGLYSIIFAKPWPGSDSPLLFLTLPCASTAAQTDGALNCGSTAVQTDGALASLRLYCCTVWRGSKLRLHCSTDWRGSRQTNVPTAPFLELAISWNRILKPKSACSEFQFVTVLLFLFNTI